MFSVIQLFSTTGYVQYQDFLVLHLYTSGELFRHFDILKFFKNQIFLSLCIINLQILYTGILETRFMVIVLGIIDSKQFAQRSHPKYL